MKSLICRIHGLHAIFRHIDDDQLHDRVVGWKRFLSRWVVVITRLDSLFYGVDGCARTIQECFNSATEADVLLLARKLRDEYAKLQGINIREFNRSNVGRELNTDI